MQRLEQMAATGYPYETCGLLLGTQHDGFARVLDVCQARNLNAERAYDRYELDPNDLLAAETAARQRGLFVIGVWHSHPDHCAQPSETDRAAAWEAWSYLILAVSREGVNEVRSWRLDPARQFLEETIES